MKGRREPALQFLRLLRRHPRYAAGLLRKKLRLARRYRWIRRHPDRCDRVPPPLVYKLVLTYRCNLDCRGCFQWGEGGWCRREKAEEVAGEIDLELVERLLARVGPGRPDFILTGGEPLAYSRFADLAGLLGRYRCHTTICTNGTLLGRQQEITARNPYLAWLVSLDGPSRVNDAIRGAGVYDLVVEGIRRLKGMNRPPWVGIQCTIRPENVSLLFSFCREMADLGVDWILLNPFWFVTEAEARAYESLLAEHFRITPREHRGFLAPFAIDADLFASQFEAIQAADWPIQISSYFRNTEDMRLYLEEPDALVGDRRCHKQWIRADITPRGEIAPCIQFPDLLAGSLQERSIMELWNGPVYARLRGILRRGPLPICARCNNIYLYDAQRKTL